MGWQLLVVPVPTPFLLARRESSGNPVSCGTPTCQPFCPSPPSLTQPGCSTSWQRSDFGKWAAGFYPLTICKGLIQRASLRLKADWAAGFSHALSKYWVGSLIITEIIFRASFLKLFWKSGSCYPTWECFQWTRLFRHHRWWLPPSELRNRGNHALTKSNHEHRRRAFWYAFPPQQ